MMPWKHYSHRLKRTNEGEGVNNTLDGQIPEGPRQNLCPNLSTKWMRPYFSSETNQNEFDLNKIMLPISTLLLPWIFVSGWEADLQPRFKWYILVDGDIPIPAYFTFAYYSLTSLTQPRTLKKNISQPSPETPQRKYKNKGILKSSQLPKETASRKTAPFRMLKFQCIF